MFDFIRTHQRLMQVILLILVVPSFVFLGISGYSFVTGDHAVAEVGKTEVTQQEFTQAQRNQLQQMQRSSQGRFDPVLLDNPQARRALLDELINRKVEIAVATREHFSVSDNALRRAIAAMPQMQANGHFSADQYHEVLASYGMSPHDFEASQRGQMSLDRVLGPIGQSATIPQPVIDGLKRALTEKRTVRLQVFKAADYHEGIEVSDDDIKKWYDDHQDDLRLPEQVAANYLVLDEAAAVASVPDVDTAQLKEYYEQNKSRYVIPGRVNVSHILVKLPAGAADDAAKAAQDKARQLAERARENPGDFAELAKNESQDAGTAREGGELGWIQHGTLPLAMEQAVFDLKQGEISDPVKGPDGYHIFKANEVEPEKGESFEQARDKVEDEVRHQLAADRFADMATKLTNLVYDNPDNLDAAAKALGLEVRHAAGIARDRLLDADEIGKDAASASADADILGDVRVRQSLFSPQVLTDKQNSGVIEISPDTMVVVRVDKVTPAHVPDLDLVHDEIRTRIEDQRAHEAAVAAGEKALKTLQDGAEPEGDMQDPSTISRLDAGGLSRAVVEAAFAVPTDKLPAYGGVDLPDAYAIIRLDDVTPGVTDEPALKGLGDQISRIWGGMEEQAVLTELRKKVGVKITDQGKKLIADGDNEAQ